MVKPSNPKPQPMTESEVRKAVLRALKDGPASMETLRDQRIQRPAGKILRSVTLKKVLGALVKAGEVEITIDQRYRLLKKN